ncbi:DinB family protein [Chryseolinea lacunae]|uniref:DinB family protein n=1 Tax=Chryseolinea lacunae TaxID=2801331 RepID=A0ABS1L1V4_9BACT|nr:DinB family protein [Chryseolinea lacunae]MBL0745639.1 DinB family protein [Chryseolinea lacunae]
MQFTIQKSVEILERTPQLLEIMLGGLSEEWIENNEGPETWSPYDVVGHLIHGEKTDWIPRMEIILSSKADKSFEPFDRFAQFDEGAPKTLTQLLNEFKALRKQNLNRLRAQNITQNDLLQEGRHPAFGPVTLSQLLATWVAHDLNHIGQISRVMAKQYEQEVGPWKAYLGILKA